MIFFFTSAKRFAIANAASISALMRLTSSEQTVVVCEGNPVAGKMSTKNAAHDATCYNAIFSSELPEVAFVSGGSSNAVIVDRLGLISSLSSLVPGVFLVRLIDRDDHTPADAARFKTDGIHRISRRTIESYLYDDEVLDALCESQGMANEKVNAKQDKADALAASIARGNAPDDLKSAAGEIFSKLRQRLHLVGAGNDALAFARNTLAPLVKPSMKVYSDLKLDIF